MDNKIAVLGLLSSNKENVENSLGAIIKQYENKILEKIYDSQLDFEYEMLTRDYYVVSRSEFKEVMQKLTEYEAFEKAQFGRQRLKLDINEIKELKSIGLSNRKIADKMKVSEGTIRNHLKIKNMFIKF